MTVENIKDFHLRCHLWQKVLTPLHLPAVSTCTYFQEDVTGQLPQETLSLAGQDSPHHVQPGLSRGVKVPSGLKLILGTMHPSTTSSCCEWIVPEIVCTINYTTNWSPNSPGCTCLALFFSHCGLAWLSCPQPPEPSPGCSACSTTCSWEPLICWEARAQWSSRGQDTSLRAGPRTQKLLSPRKKRDILSLLRTNVFFLIIFKMKWHIVIQSLTALFRMNAELKLMGLIFNL